MSEVQETVTISLYRYHKLLQAEQRLDELVLFGRDSEFQFLRVETYPHSWIVGYAKQDILPLIEENNTAIEKWRAEMRKAYEPKPKPSFLKRIFCLK